MYVESAQNRHVELWSARFLSNNDGRMPVIVLAVSRKLIPASAAKVVSCVLSCRGLDGPLAKWALQFIGNSSNKLRPVENQACHMSEDIQHETACAADVSACCHLDIETSIAN